MINATNLICRTAGCPSFGDWAIKNKLTVPFSKAKRGDIVLFDFNHNGTSDHIGIVTKAGDGYIETVEGNTGNGLNTNGDGVYKRTRYKSNVNYIVRPKYTSAVTAEMIVATALSQVGYREGKNNDNKYGKWFGQNHVSWCCIFVVWVFAHVITSNKPYTGTFPSLIPSTARVAVDCCYKYGTKKSHLYKGGKPKQYYKDALNKVYPNRKWGAKSQAGASCDVFVGTVLRLSGVDKNFPRGLAEQIPWLKKKYKTVSSAKNGDILLRSNHIAIAVNLKGTLYVANAHHELSGGTYGVIEKKGSFTKIYRPVAEGTALKKGDKFTDVKYLQKFLNWYGDYGLAIDCDFGIKTEAAVKSFQKLEGLVVDGEFGKKSLAKAKAIKK